MHENRETSRTSAQADRSGKVKYPSSGHVRFGGVGLGHSTDEATEQRGESFCGGGGGKGADQGERRLTQHVSDTARSMRVSGVRRRTPRDAGQDAEPASKAKRTSTLLSKVGAVCTNSASTGLCGGRRVTAVPTATESEVASDALSVDGRLCSTSSAVKAA